MDKIYACLWLFLLLGMGPLILGLPWTYALSEKRSFSLAYSIGFFVQLALFQFSVAPIVLLNGKFKAVILFFSVLFIGACVWSLLSVRTKHLVCTECRMERLSGFECIYLCAFLVVFGVQLYKSVTSWVTYMSYDDAVYTVAAEQALEGMRLGRVNTQTGEAFILNLKYGMPGWLYFPALLAFFSGLSVATSAHTVLSFQLLILAYAVYWYMSGMLFKKRENRLIFMVFISLFYWFGNFSDYALNFRLLGPNYQGKAVVAVSLTPLVLSLLIGALEKPFQWCFAALAFLLSAAACSLSFWGVGTYLVVLALPIVISLVLKGRNIRYFYYIVSGSVLPALMAALYFLQKYAV